MYSYTFDAATGGILLNSTPTNFSKEPRPVYAAELDILGFDRYWDYEKQNDVPYMWAESSLYWYRGVLLARAKGGDLYTAPELQPALAEDGGIPFGRERGAKLEAMDIAAMCAANAELMGVIEDATAKRIVGIYEKYKDKLDIFHVACSGGKDSAVMLDLVKRALPRGSFVVIFGDTGMEFPDTYTAIEETRRECEAEGIAFYTARSHFDPQESWALFGPPSRTLRWCCSVHKSTPQTLKLREITGKNDYVGLDFVGVRKHESLSRSTYVYENYGKKQRGQYSHNPILEWTSAEIWLYIYIHKLNINEAYIKGCARVGCLFCPMEGYRGDCFQHRCFPNEVDKYVDIIKSLNERNQGDEVALSSYVASGGWNARKNGRDLTISEVHYWETEIDGKICIEVTKPKADWNEWVKTVGKLPFQFEFKKKDDGYYIIYDAELKKIYPKEISRFRQVFKKAGYCIGCKVCETNCRNGRLRFVDGRVQITDCLQCGMCHDIEDGCLAYHSLRQPGGGETVKKESLNTFANHAPKDDWVKTFFKDGTDYLNNSGLNKKNELPYLKKFLRWCGLIDKNDNTTMLYDIVSSNKMGYENVTTWGLALSNFAYNAQCRWFITNMDIDACYEREHIKNMLMADGVASGDTTSIINSFKALCNLPLGKNLNFGSTEEKGKNVVALFRTKCNIEDARVLLYSLYIFIEKSNIYNEFTMSYLYEDEGDRDGISPVRIFGLYDREELKSMLLGLSAAYPDFINAAFTNDMQSIMLRDKSSADVLALFKEDE